MILASRNTCLYSPLHIRHHDTLVCISLRPRHREALIVGLGLVQTIVATHSFFASLRLD